jgi:hypothetical protein
VNRPRIVFVSVRCMMAKYGILDDGWKEGERESFGNFGSIQWGWVHAWLQ